MREIVFLKRNAEKWKQFEVLLSSSGREDPDTLADLFIELTDDLSYARTYYPDSETTRYLNELTRKVHETIYRNKKEEKNRFRTFWTTEIPLVIQKHHKELLISFSFFIVAMLIGLLSAANDPTFIRMIMGDRYVDMTLQNINKGDPMAVYKQMEALPMFLGITTNNIFVSFKAFGTGNICICRNFLHPVYKRFNAWRFSIPVLSAWYFTPRDADHLDTRHTGNFICYHCRCRRYYYGKQHFISGYVFAHGSFSERGHQTV